MEPIQIPLPGSVGVAHVAQLHTTALQGIEAGSSVVFDMSETRDMDASIVQLILAARTLTESRDLETKITGLSDSLSASLSKVGADALLEIVAAQPEVQEEPANAPDLDDAPSELTVEEAPTEEPVASAEPAAPAEPEVRQATDSETLVDQLAAEAAAMDQPDAEQISETPSTGALVAAASSFFGDIDNGDAPESASPPETGTTCAETEETASAPNPESVDNENTDLVHDSATTSAPEGMDE